MTVKDSNGMTLFDAKDMVTLEAVEPNGPDCEPTCFQASVTFQP